MKNTSDSSTGKKAAAKRRRTCLMAYTLNNSQPVICTLVADQPYFYMEEDQISDDDDILGLEEYADFERDMADLKKKMDAFERVSKNYERDPERRLSAFAANAQAMGGDDESSLPLLQQVDKITAHLSGSRMAKALLDFAHDHSVHIVESDQVESAYYDRSSGKILIHPDLGEAEAVMMAVRELRRHWQHRKGVLIHPLTFHPDQAILINRAQIADLTIAMIRSAWELQLAGHRQCWDYIEHSAMADLGRVFAREAFVDFRSIASGKASSSVFESWFLSERCRHQDKKLIQAMLADHQGYVFSELEASRSVSIELISALGEQPYGKNYLAQYAQMIIEDPIFTEVRDRSNANFLWFIKFERSFRETEQALQSDEEQGDDVLSNPSHTKKGSEDNGTASIIIPLIRNSGLIHNQSSVSCGSLSDSAGTGANVIRVRFGEGQGA